MRRLSMRLLLRLLLAFGRGLDALNAAGGTPAGRQTRRSLGYRARDLEGFGDVQRGGVDVSTGSDQKVEAL